MSNEVGHFAQPDLIPIGMSNGLTSVFISVLSLAASELARSDRHRELAVWLASHDQAVCGTGCVGFDVSELPWSAASLDDDKDFLLGVINAAMGKTGWERLGYEPNEETVRSCLAQFAAMLRAFRIEHACGDTTRVWQSFAPPTRFALCEEHRVYLHEHGCVLCNDR